MHICSLNGSQTHSDCGDKTYCDVTNSCFDCSFITDASMCDAIDDSCCSSAFLKQCTSNPASCSGFNASNTTAGGLVEQPAPKNSVTAQLTIDKSLDSIPPGSSARKTFVTSFRKDMGKALGVNESRIIVQAIKSGSVIVSFGILPDKNGAALNTSKLVEAFQTKGVTIAGAKTVDTLTASKVTVQKEQTSSSPPPPPPPPPAPSPSLSPSPPLCATGCQAKDRSDGICDSACNNVKCNYDDGDCSRPAPPPPPPGTRNSAAHVDQMSTSVDGNHTTYRMIVTLQERGSSVYALVGTSKTSMVVPPAYQTPTFGVNYGGIKPGIVKVVPKAGFDSWLTVGITDGSDGLLATGIDWAQWNASVGINDNDAGVFWGNPSNAPKFESGPVTVGQLTVKKDYRGNVTMALAGKLANNETWRDEGVVFKLGPPPPPPTYAVPSVDAVSTSVDSNHTTYRCASALSHTHTRLAVSCMFQALSPVRASFGFRWSAADCATMPPLLLHTW